MRHILRLHELTADPWRYLGEDAAAAQGVIVPLAEWRRTPEAWSAWRGPLGVRLSPVDRVEDLSADLGRVQLVAAEFPSPGEGRGYTQGQLLRGRFGFRGELRAVGAGVKQDLIWLLARCGFDAFELAPGEDPQAAAAALRRYDVVYQASRGELPVRGQRFFAA
jgi:uncharacterized protein (DUF934 family)